MNSEFSIVVLDYVPNTMCCSYVLSNESKLPSHPYLVLVMLEARAFQSQMTGC